MPGDGDGHRTAHDRIEAAKRAARIGWVGVQIGGALAGPITDAHALQQAAIDDPSGVTYRREDERQKDKQYADYRKVRDEQRGGVPELQHGPTRTTREKGKPRGASRDPEERRSEATRAKRDLRPDRDR